MKDLAHRAAFLVAFGYDGAPFFGLQPQPGLPTAGGALQHRLAEAAGHPPRALAFAARTDRGVHARLNLATCWFPVAEIDAALVAKGLAAPHDDGLFVVGVWRVAPTVHARNVSAGKHYRYVVVDGADEQAVTGAHGHAWAVAPALDVAMMAEAGSLLCGTWDFTSLRGGGCSAATPVKTISRLDVVRDADGRIVIDIEGDAFLRHMVRNLAGLLVEVGSGLRSPAEVPAVVAARHRQAAGLMAPPGGLTLVEVKLRDGEPGTRLA